MAMTDTAEFRSLDKTEALRNGYVNPYYLEDLKHRVSVAKVDGKLYALRPLHLRQGALPALGGTAHGHHADVPVPRVTIRHRHRRGPARAGDRGARDVRRARAGRPDPGSGVMSGGGTPGREGGTRWAT
jgi:hypothetical protein